MLIGFIHLLVLSCWYCAILTVTGCIQHTEASITTSTRRITKRSIRRSTAVILQAAAAVAAAAARVGLGMSQRRLGRRIRRIRRNTRNIQKNMYACMSVCCFAVICYILSFIVILISETHSDKTKQAQEWVKKCAVRTERLLVITLTTAPIITE